MKSQLAGMMNKKEQHIDQKTEYCEYQIRYPSKEKDQRYEELDEDAEEVKIIITERERLNYEKIIDDFVDIKEQLLAEEENGEPLVIETGNWSTMINQVHTMRKKG